MANLSGPALETALGAMQLRVATRALEHLGRVLLQAPNLLCDRIELGARDRCDQRVRGLNLFRSAHQVEGRCKSAERIRRAPLRPNIRAVLVAIALPVFSHRDDYVRVPIDPLTCAARYESASAALATAP